MNIPSIKKYMISEAILSGFNLSDELINAPDIAVIYYYHLKKAGILGMADRLSTALKDYNLFDNQALEVIADGLKIGRDAFLFANPNYSIVKMKAILFGLIIDFDFTGMNLDDLSVESLNILYKNRKIAKKI